MIRRLIPLFIGLAALALVACETPVASTPASTPTPAPTATPVPTPTPTPTPTPVPVSGPAAAALAESMRAAIEKAGSFHVDMDLNMALSAQGLSLDVPFKFNGDFQAPDKMRGSLTASVLGFALNTEFVQIGDKSWIKDLQTGMWQEGEGAEGVMPFSPDDFLGDEFLASPDSPVTDLTLAGTETLDGTQVWHYTATIPAEKLDVKGGDFKLDMYVGVADQLPRKITLKGEVDLGGAMEGQKASQIPLPTGPAKFDLVMLISKFGLQVAITPPPGF